MNWVKENRKKLEPQNYVLKADITSNYWFGVSKNKIEDYKSKFNSDFNIILYGSESDESDFYSIPFSFIEDLLIDENLYNFNNRLRWVGDIRNHVLRIRNSKKERNISVYFGTPFLDKALLLLNEKQNYYSIESTKQEILVAENLNDYAIEDAKKEVLVRIKQSAFRRKIMLNFQGRCCLTGISESELLVASHIIPWATKNETRLSPHNGLCLSVLYDSLFDKGFLLLMIITK